MKIGRKRASRLLNELTNDEAVYRTAPATPGLLNTVLTESGLVQDEEYSKPPGQATEFSIFDLRSSIIDLWEVL